MTRADIQHTARIQLPGCATSHRIIEALAAETSSSTERTIA